MREIGGAHGTGDSPHDHSAGLTYHDAIAETGVYSKAFSRLPADLQVAHQVSAHCPTATTGVAELLRLTTRSRTPRLPTQKRMKRALDLSQKHVDIPTELREDPWREYKAVREVFSETQKEVSA